MHIMEQVFSYQETFINSCRVTVMTSIFKVLVLKANGFTSKIQSKLPREPVTVSYVKHAVPVFTGKTFCTNIYLVVFQ